MWGIPNKNFHTTASFVKSLMRIIGLIMLLIKFPVGVWVLIFAELVGIVEEL